VSNFITEKQHTEVEVGDEGIRALLKGVPGVDLTMLRSWCVQEGLDWGSFAALSLKTNVLSRVLLSMVEQGLLDDTYYMRTLVDGVKECGEMRLTAKHPFVLVTSQMITWFYDRGVYLSPRDNSVSFEEKPKKAWKGDFRPIQSQLRSDEKEQQLLGAIRSSTVGRVARLGRPQEMSKLLLIPGDRMIVRQRWFDALEELVTMDLQFVPDNRSNADLINQQKGIVRSTLAEHGFVFLEEGQLTYVRADTLKSVANYKNAWTRVKLQTENSLKNAMSLLETWGKDRDVGDDVVIDERQRVVISNQTHDTLVRQRPTKQNVAMARLAVAHAKRILAKGSDAVDRAERAKREVIALKKRVNSRMIPPRQIDAALINALSKKTRGGSVDNIKSTQFVRSIVDGATLDLMESVLPRAVLNAIKNSGVDIHKLEVDSERDVKTMILGHLGIVVRVKAPFMHRETKKIDTASRRVHFSRTSARKAGSHGEVTEEDDVAVFRAYRKAVDLVFMALAWCHNHHVPLALLGGVCMWRLFEMLLMKMWPVYLAYNLLKMAYFGKILARTARYVHETDMSLVAVFSNTPLTSIALWQLYSGLISTLLIIGGVERNPGMSASANSPAPGFINSPQSDDIEEISRVIVDRRRKNEDSLKHLVVGSEILTERYTEIWATEGDDLEGSLVEVVARERLTKAMLTLLIDSGNGETAELYAPSSSEVRAIQFWSRFGNFVEVFFIVLSNLLDSVVVMLFGEHSGVEPSISMAKSLATRYSAVVDETNAFDRGVTLHAVIVTRREKLRGDDADHRVSVHRGTDMKVTAIPCLLEYKRVIIPSETSRKRRFAEVSTVGQVFCSILQVAPHLPPRVVTNVFQFDLRTSLEAYHSSPGDNVRVSIANIPRMVHVGVDASEERDQAPGNGLFVVARSCGSRFTAGSRALQTTLKGLAKH
jgi:hypothetical protein